MSIFGTSKTANGFKLFNGSAVSASAIATALGDLIIVGVSQFSAAAQVPSASDTAGNSYTPLPYFDNPLFHPNVGGLRFFYCLKATAASDSNVVSADAGQGDALIFVWDVPCSGDAAFDVQVGSQDYQSTLPFSTTGDDEFVAVMCASEGSNLITAGAGYTLDCDPALNGLFGYLSHTDPLGSAEHATFSSPQSAIRASFVASVHWSSGEQLNAAVAFRSASATSFKSAGTQLTSDQMEAIEPAQSDHGHVFDGVVYVGTIYGLEEDGSGTGFIVPTLDLTLRAGQKNQVRAGMADIMYGAQNGDSVKFAMIRTSAGDMVARLVTGN